MRRTPVYDPFDDRDDLPEEAPQNVRRISTTPGYEPPPRRSDVRPLRGATRRPPPRRGPDPRVWFVRGAIGVAALAGLWLGLQTLFPVSESQVSQAPASAPTVPTEASAVGAPEPPAAQAVAQQPAPQADQSAAQAAPAQAAPAQAAPAQAAPVQAAPVQPAPTEAPPAPTAAPIQVEPSQGDRLPGMAQQPAQPQQAAQAPAPEPTAAPQPEARQETPSQQPVGNPTLAPIPPPPGGAQAQNPQQQAAQQAAQQAVAAAPKPQAPAPKPQAPPAAQATGGPFELSASASPVNPISENAVVTVTVRATQNGAALAGASCMATVYYRTNTARQPAGGFRTNGSGVGSFTLDARGSTYGHYIPVDVTCSGRGGSVTARTGFTPVRGR